MTVESTLDHGLKKSTLGSLYKAEYDANLEELDPNRITTGLASARPSAGTQYRFYYATDVYTLYYDDGADWLIITGGYSLNWQDSVIDKDLLTPPAHVGGARYLINGTGTGDWAGHDYDIAQSDGIGWSFTSPQDGMQVFVEDEDVIYLYNAGSWGVTGFKAINVAGNISAGGVIHPSWASNLTVAQVDLGSLTNDGVSTTQLSNNAYFDGAWKRITAAYASQIMFDLTGAIRLRTAGTDAADSVISTWVEALTLSNTGAVTIPGTVEITGALQANGGINTTSITASTSLDVVGGISRFSRADTTPTGTATTTYNDGVFGSTGTASTGITIFGTGVTGIAFGDAGDSDIGRIGYSHATNSMDFITNNTIGMTIDDSQNVSIPVGTLNVISITATNVALPIVIGTGPGDDFTINTTGFVYEGDTGFFGLNGIPDHSFHNQLGATLFGDVWPSVSIGSTGERVAMMGTSGDGYLIIGNNQSGTGTNRAGQIWLGARGTTATADMAFVKISGARESATSGNKSTYLSILTSNSGGASTEGFRIDSSQNVLIPNGDLGIGIDPLLPLHVIGIIGAEAGGTEPNGSFIVGGIATGWLLTAGIDAANSAAWIQSRYNANTNTGKLILNPSGGDVGIRIDIPDGTLHVHTATAGVISANADVDDLVVENNDHCGITIFSPASKDGSIAFGTLNNNRDCRIVYAHGATSETGVFNIITGSAISIGIDSSNNVSMPNGNLTVSGGIDTDGTVLKTKVVETGPWNMQSDSSIFVPHGFGATTLKKIRSISIAVRNDADTMVYPENGGMLSTDGSLRDMGINSLTSTNILFVRLNGGLDNANFSKIYDGGDYNRGWVTIVYEAY